MDGPRRPCAAVVCGLFARFCCAATAPFPLPLRFAGTAVSFMMNSMGVVSFMESAAAHAATFPRQIPRHSFIGTWKLNPAKSKYKTGAPAKEQTVLIFSAAE
jgi:hypothetical protein